MIESVAYAACIGDFGQVGLVRAEFKFFGWILSLDWLLPRWWWCSPGFESWHWCTRHSVSLVQASCVALAQAPALFSSVAVDGVS